MEKFVLIGDINCDLPKELRDKYEIDYLKGHITLDSKNDIESDLDWKCVNRDYFYKELKNKKNTFTSSPASSEETKEKFKEYLDKGIKVIYLTISSALSGSYSFAMLAKKELDLFYPDMIEVIDSKRYSGSLGLLLVLASIYKNNGHSFKETVNYIEQTKNKIHQMGPMDDLFFLARKGRITNGKAFFGTLVGIKPLGDFDESGKTSVLTKAKGINQAIKFSTNYIKKTISNPKEQILFISHSDRIKNAKLLKDAILKEVEVKDIIIFELCPTSAINVGPGLCACFYLGEDISDNKKKEIMEEVVKSE